LEAFKDFFKNNLNEILSPGLISKTFGYQYQQDLEKPYKMADWDEFVPYADPGLLNLMSSQERKEK